MAAAEFKTKTAVWLAVAAGVSLLATVLLSAFAKDLAKVVSSSTDSFSRSAIGHAAFVESLRRAGVPVVVSRHRTIDKIGGEELLVVAETDVEALSVDHRRLLYDMWFLAPKVLLVLPKRRGFSRADKPGWLATSNLMPIAAVAAVLDTLGYEARVTRIAQSDAEPTVDDGVTSTSCRLDWRGIDDLSIMRLQDKVPAIRDLQLLKCDEFDPLLACEEGMLLGRWEAGGDEVYVLSDPDLLANHGLGKGDNATVLFGALDEWGLLDRPIVVDETLHGFEFKESIFAFMLRYPLVLLTYQAVLAAAVLIWMAVVRFGSLQTAISGVASGKEALVAHTAELLEHGGDSATTLRQYVASIFTDVARRLHAPARLNRRDTLSWLQKVSDARGLNVDLLQVERTSIEWEHGRSPRRRDVLEVAARMHRWRQELTHETR